MVVTGSNTGLGLGLVRALLKAHGDDAIVYLTARSQERGQQAVEQLNKEGLSPAFHLLDITDEDSIATFVDHIQETHDGIDVFIGNAAARISPDYSKAEQIEAFINTNNHGTHRLIQQVEPILNDDAHFIVVASSFGSLRNLDEKLHPLFDVETKSLDDIDATMRDYTQLVLDQKDVDYGYPEWMNIPSKIGQVASNKIFAREMQQHPERNLHIHSVCPGLVDTDASRPWFDDMSNAQSPDAASVDVLWVLETSIPNGELIQHRKVIEWQP